MAKNSVELSPLHSGQVTFRFQYGRDPKPLMFMISGFPDVSLSPKTNIIYFLRHQGTSNDSRKIQNQFSKMLWEIPTLWKSCVFANGGKDRRRQIPTTRLINA